MRLSIRARLTLMQVGLLVVFTAVLLGTSWWLLARHLDRTLTPDAADLVLGGLATQYVIATAGAALVALGLGWILAGSALAPIRAIIATARRISEDRLDARVRHAGPEDELHDLAGAFDEMLDRVEGTVTAQRRFVANASHELRTPLTVMRAEAEVALEDPDATVEEVAGVVVESVERMERLIDSLLVLATSTEGSRRDEPVDLAVVARRAVRGAAGGFEVSLRRRGGDELFVRGDDALLERLTGNLVENAVRYGRDPRVSLRREGGEAILTVANGGDPIPRAALPSLVQPFQRLDRARRGGSGLGLSIVDAVARAHGGSLRLEAPPSGGLVAEVRLPAARGYADVTEAAVASAA